jgi:hypothetical protein
MLLQAKINTVNFQIVDIQEQIARLQAQLTDLQSFAQSLQSVDQAADSALQQVSQAVALINAVCPEELETFKAAINAMMDGEKPALPEVKEVTETVESQSVEPTPEITVEVESAPVDEQPDVPETSEPIELQNGSGNGNGNGHHKDTDKFVMLATIEELKACDRPRLVKLANKYQIPGYQNKTRDKLAELLTGKVTVDEITPASVKG